MLLLRQGSAASTSDVRVSYFGREIFEAERRRESESIRPRPRRRRVKVDNAGLRFCPSVACDSRNSQVAVQEPVAIERRIDARDAEKRPEGPRVTAKARIHCAHRQRENRSSE